MNAPYIPEKVTRHKIQKGRGTGWICLDARLFCVHTHHSRLNLSKCCDKLTISPHETMIETDCKCLCKLILELGFRYSLNITDLLKSFVAFVKASKQLNKKQQITWKAWHLKERNCQPVLNIFFTSNDSNVFKFTQARLHDPCFMSMFWFCFCHCLKPSTFWS